MFQGASLGRKPESRWKNTNHGNLIPACRNTPADAAVSSIYTHTRPSFAAACDIILLVVKPEVRGKLEMDRAPIMQQSVVSGMVW